MAPNDFQDISPYSRNLILISLLIIIFNFGDGQLIDNYLKLHVINIKFNNIEFFPIFVFVTFFWFVFRFWQSNKFKMDDILFNVSENNIYMSNKQLIKYVESNCRLKYRASDNGFFGIVLSERILLLDKNGQQQPRNTVSLDKNTLSWKLVYISLFKDVLIKDIKALEAYTPYFLAIIAFVSSCYSMIF